MKTIKRNQEWPMKGKELHDDRIFNLNKRKTATSHSCRPHQWHPLSTRQSARPKNITGSCKPHYTNWHSPAVPRSEKRRPTVWTGIRQRTVSSCKISRLADCSCILSDNHSRNAEILALVEQIQQQNLSFFEEASAIERLISHYGMTQEDAAAKLGKAQSTIANKLRLLRLTETERDIILQYNPTERHARALPACEHRKNAFRFSIKWLSRTWTWKKQRLRSKKNWTASLQRTISETEHRLSECSGIRPHHSSGSRNHAGCWHLCWCTKIAIWYAHWIPDSDSCSAAECT